MSFGCLIPSMKSTFTGSSLVGPKLRKQTCSSKFIGAELSNNFNVDFAEIPNKYLDTNLANKSCKFPKLENFIQSKKSKDVKYSIPQMEYPFVLKYLQKLSVSTATGLGGFSARFLKISAPVIATQVYAIYM